MNYTTKIIAFLLLAIFSGCNEKSKNSPYTSMDYLEICEEFDSYAFEQKELLAQIREKYKADQTFITRFNEEQISWIQYQDRRLRSLYPKDWDRFYRKNYGVETFNGCKCKELIRLSEIRKKELMVYLEGTDPSQENCPVQGQL